MVLQFGALDWRIPYQVPQNAVSHQDPVVPQNGCFLGKMMGLQRSVISFGALFCSLTEQMTLGYWLLVTVFCTV